MGRLQKRCNGKSPEKDALFGSACVRGSCAVCVVARAHRANRANRANRAYRANRSNRVKRANRVNQVFAFWNICIINSVLPVPFLHQFCTRLPAAYVRGFAVERCGCALVVGVSGCSVSI